MELLLGNQETKQADPETSQATLPEQSQTSDCRNRASPLLLALDLRMIALRNQVQKVRLSGPVE
jgi:hypothetical protein